MTFNCTSVNWIKTNQVQFILLRLVKNWKNLDFTRLSCALITVAASDNSSENDNDDDDDDDDDDESCMYTF